MNEAIVIGGGIVGTSIAFHLVRQGMKTTLFDRQDPGRATAAGAGILSSELGLETDSYAALASAALAYYPQLVAQLPVGLSGDTGFARCGELLVAVSEDEVAPFERVRELILAHQRRQPPLGKARLLSPGEAAELFPALAPVRGAIYFEQAGRVDGRRLTQAMRQAAEQAGLQVQPVGVERLVITDSRIHGVVAGGDTFPADRVAIAGGAWSAAFAAQLGLPLLVEPQRGQLVHLKLPDAEMGDWPIVSAFRGHYLVPWPEGRVVAGATHESGVGFKAHATAIGLYEVLHEALRVAPGLSQAELMEVRVGLRPVTPDGLPLIGPVPGVDQLYLAAGHGATGLHLGPYTGKVVADWMLGQPLELDLSAFNLARFL
ncbi:MAG: FAD-dependent oxidoreductase [Anaerolineae bacterium]|nr:FAD-dependent oxidoreductase [Anaerolineae bacterium]